MRISRPITKNGCEQLDNDVEITADNKKFERTVHYFVRILVLGIIIFLMGLVWMGKIMDLKKSDKHGTAPSGAKAMDGKRTDTDGHGRGNNK